MFCIMFGFCTCFPTWSRAHQPFLSPLGNIMVKGSHLICFCLKPTPILDLSLSFVHMHTLIDWGVILLIFDEILFVWWNIVSVEELSDLLCLVAVVMLGVMAPVKGPQRHLLSVCSTCVFLDHLVLFPKSLLPTWDCNVWKAQNILYGSRVKYF